MLAASASLVSISIWSLVVLVNVQRRRRNGQAVAGAKTPQTESDPVDKEMDAEELQRTKELAEIAPGWLTAAIIVAFMLGWVFVGALWNFGTHGLWIGFGVLGAITYGVIRCQLPYCPELSAELARQSTFRRGLALILGGAGFAVAMTFVVNAQVATWDYWGHSWDLTWLTRMPGDASGVPGNRFVPAP